MCRVLGQHRSTQRKMPCGADDEEALTEDIIELAKQYGRYGYRRVTALLHASGWSVNHKRVERIWRREGLKVPQKQPKRGRLWLNDGSCIRLRPEYPGHVWAYDFVEARTHDGRKFHVNLRLIVETDAGRRSGGGGVTGPQSGRASGARGCRFCRGRSGAQRSGEDRGKIWGTAHP